MAPRLLCAVAALSLFVTRTDDAGACSCIQPNDALLFPNQIGLPVNSKVCIDLLGRNRQDMPTLRALMSGGEIATTARSWRDGEMTAVELTPTQLLLPRTAYEVVLKSRTQRVIGEFTTGTDYDQSAPTLDSIGTISADANPNAFGPACEAAGPWIRIGPLRASDPGRPDAKLLYPLWVADSAGNVDTSLPPDRLLKPNGNVVTIGRQSLCQPHDYRLTSGATFTFALSVVDDAGNTDVPQQASITLP